MSEKILTFNCDVQISKSMSDILFENMVQFYLQGGKAGEWLRKCV